MNISKDFINIHKRLNEIQKRLDDKNLIHTKDIEYLLKESKDLIKIIHYILNEWDFEAGQNCNVSRNKIMKIRECLDK